MSELGKLGWANVKDSSNRIWIFDSNATMELDEVDRQELLKVDSYVTYSIPQYGTSKGFITIYEIKERVVDAKNNLILITESKTVDLK